MQIMEGFPSSVRGRILFIDKDNLNTDGIYGEQTHLPRRHDARADGGGHI